jgi:hypothetical protein
LDRNYAKEYFGILENILSFLNEIFIINYSTHMCPSLYLEDAKNTTCYAPHHQLCGGTFVG